ncbi:MAG TPA: hypothetical protein VFQ65_20835 [Kofleriaceae bacterium]|nr:hypothetical protein [Kofleriaceae bacterium]
MSAPLYFVAAATLLAACQPASADPDDPHREPPHTAKLDESSIARFHMRAKLYDVRRIELALLRDKLVEAKILARAVVTAPDEPALAEWAPMMARVREQAQAVATANSGDEALRHLPHLAAACAECHVATGNWPAVENAPAAPADGPVVLRMARHQWATDRMWDGMIGGREDAWHVGLVVLAATPAPFAIVDGDEVALAKQLQSLATAALRDRSADSLDTRVRIYGELLVTCAACHETNTRRKP